MTIPCKTCCPTGITRCRRNPLLTPCTLALAETLTTSPVPNQALATANPNNFNIFNLAVTADGDTSGGSYGGIRTGNGQNATNVVIEYRWNTAINKAIQIRLWNNGGGFLNDGDGIGTALVTLLDGDGAVLWQGNLVAGNGGAIYVTDLNGTAQANEINGIRVMRLSNITNLAGAAVDIIWRNINLRLRYAATLAWTCGGQRVVTAIAEGLDDGFSVAGNVVTHNNGPHIVTFNSPIAFTGQIVTASPGSFSALNIQNGSTITISGTAAKTFTVNYTFDDPAFGLPAFCMLCEGSPVWYDSGGAVVNPANLIDCV